MSKACLRHVMPEACFQHVMPEACFQHDAAIGLSWLTPQGRGPFALPVRRESLQTMRFAALPLLPVMSETCFQHDTKVLASMPIHL